MSSSLSAVVCQILSVLKVLKAFTMISKIDGIDETQSNWSLFPPPLFVVTFFFGAAFYQLTQALSAYRPYLRKWIRELCLPFYLLLQRRSLPLLLPYVTSHQYWQTTWRGTRNIPKQPCEICIQCGLMDSPIVSFDQSRSRTLKHPHFISWIWRREESERGTQPDKRESRSFDREVEGRVSAILFCRFVGKSASAEWCVSGGMEGVRETCFMKDFARSKVDGLVISLLSPLNRSTSSTHIK